MDWSYFDKFEAVNKKYLPIYGEGDTMATQICTAVNKIIYKWYNDGDVYDNTYWLDGWGNDLSSYANWVYKHAPIQDTLNKIATIHSNEEYEDNILVPMANLLDEFFLEKMNDFNKVDSIYKCTGPFKFEYYDDDDEYYY